MFDIGATELLVIAIVAVLVIGPKDLPLALRTAGRWIGKFRRTTAHFRTGIDAMVREAEMEDLDKKWREQNARIMAEYPDEQMTPLDPGPGALSAAEAREAQVSATDAAADADSAGAPQAKLAEPAPSDVPPAAKQG